jgi:hypothetical protein
MQYSEEFVVTDEKLRAMALDMIGQYGLIQLMRDAGYKPESTQTVESIDWTVLMTLWSPSGVYNIFHEFDSIYHNKPHNQKPHVYRGQDSAKDLPCLGTEVNYYFQGILFRAFGYGFARALTQVAAWKKLSAHGGVTDNIKFFLNKGWRELPQLWPQALFNERLDQNRQWRADVRMQYKRQKKS